jgi:hypothetical protein
MASLEPCGSISASLGVLSLSFHFVSFPSLFFIPSSLSLSTPAFLYSHLVRSITAQVEGATVHVIVQPQPAITLFSTHSLLITAQTSLLRILAATDNF